MALVLSLFSGLGALDEGFRQEGYYVVSAGDVAWSSLYDVRRFHPPDGVFDGVIGGDPCQSHSTLANLVRAKGLEPSFPDMTPELVRVIEEARPAWFLRENVLGAPWAVPKGYAVRRIELDHSTMDAGDDTGHEQMRKRSFWFGVRGERWWDAVPDLRKHLDFAFFVLPDPSGTVQQEPPNNSPERKLRRRASPAQPGCPRRSLGGSGKVKSTRAPTVSGGHGEPSGTRDAIARRQAATGRHPGAIRSHGGENAPRYSLDEMLDLQGLPRDVFKHSPLTKQGKRKLVGNAVPLPMACAIARAVKKALS